MKTNDEILKIKATLLYILESFPEGVDFIKLFKILYFAQQNHLVKYGRPIVKDTFCALDFGPIPSFTYKAFQCALSEEPLDCDIKDFNKDFSIQRIKKISYVKGIIKADSDELSVSDLNILDNSIRENKDIDSLKLSKKSHDNAWKDAYNRAIDDPEKDRMTIIDIARAGNATEKMIKYIRENEMYINHF